MGKRARRKREAAPAEAAEVGPRQPCPCGSGRRYKACHGRDGGSPPFVARAFEGLPNECDWIALREFVPAATAPLPLRDHSHTVQLCSLLPGGWPAMVRDSGDIWLGLQVQHDSGDASRDLARTLELALETEAGSPVALDELPGPGTRLQDLVDPDADLEVTVHAGFDFWVSDVDDPSGEIAASLEAANEATIPTARLESVDAAYWCDVGTKEHLRWVMPHEEDTALNALARLHARGADALFEGSRLVGSFRAYGLLVPVWDLPVGTGAAAVEEPAAAFGERFGEAAATTGPLSADERSARAGLANRQLTIR
ncbi:MAG: topoisomerase II [Propionibacteriales bacterium]|nr:topoisomerase II [Propionibacteriales bacterium]